MRTSARAALLALMTSIAAVPLIATTPAAATPAAAPRRPIPSTALVTVTDAGFEPSTISPVVGQVVQFDNVASKPVTVRSATGAFDSGAVPVGGSFSLIVPVAGLYPYSSPELSAIGTLDVGLLDLEGADADLATAHLPGIATPPDGTFDSHPTLTIHASRTRAMVLLNASATVAQANAALTAADVTIVGTVPRLGVVAVAVDDPGPGDFTAIDAAVATLRAQPGVAAAAISTPAETEAIPQPAETAMVTRGSSSWAWHGLRFSDSGGGSGDGGNWGLESARFPFAWNLNDQVFDTGAAIQTGVVDQGFSANADLGGTSVKLCTGLVAPVCTENGVGNHGTHVAGTIGARWDNDNGSHRSVGVSGGNPVADLQLMPWKNVDPTILISNALFEKKAGGQLPNLRVINYSGTNNALVRDPAPSGSAPGSVGPYSWGRVWAGKLCGPGAGDDATKTVPCTPDTEDGALGQTAALGAIARAVAQEAARKDVAIVVAAGNDSAGICAAPVAQPPCAGSASLVVLDARKRHPFGWASANWTGATANPIILVEAIDQGRARADFSNVGGDVSAPGYQILSTVPTTVDPSGYDLSSGTSMAAPHVSALVGYLLAYRPSLTTAEVKQLIIGHAQPDTTGGAQPRIDAYASILAIAGAGKDLVDINDPSTDGNRRVVRSGVDLHDHLDTLSGRGKAGKPTYTDPDGVVDLRDFRRFRDAWLETCQGTGPRDSACPDAANVVLDGGARHIKKDLNLDRCVYSADATLGCDQTLETSFSRFDFNGDGRIGLTTAAVPLNADGTPTATGNGWTPNDLQLFQAYFDALPSVTDGWTKAELPNLLDSADVEVHADAFFDAGADSVNITVEDKASGTWVPGPDRTMDTNDPYIVATQPVGATGADVRVRAEATIDGHTLRSAPITVPMKPGQDARVDLCIPSIQVKPDDSTLFTRSGAARVRLSLTLCPGTDPAATGAPKPGKQTIGLSLKPTGAPAPVIGNRAHQRAGAPTPSAGAELSAPSVTTDDAGNAVVDLAPGTDPQDLEIDAESDLTPPGETQPITAVGSAPVSIDDPPKLIYRYEQVTTGWNYDSSFTKDIGSPNEDVVSIRESAADLPYRIERAGTLTPTANGGAMLSEAVSGDDLLADVSVSSSLNGTTESVRRTFVYPSQSKITDANVSYPRVLLDSTLPNGLPRTDFQWYGGVRTDVSADRTQVSFDQLEDLDGVTYPYATTDAADPKDPNGRCTGFCGDPEKDQLQFIEREIRSGMRYSDLVPDDVGHPGALTRVLNFSQDDTGKWSTPYTYCTPIRTYPLRGIDAGQVLGEGSGTATSSFRFVAAIADGSTTKPEDLTLPDCTAAKDTPPTALFDPSERTPEEGRIVTFTDHSSGSVTKWAWDFGDGSASTEQNPSHTYDDNGSYDVSLVVTDADGRTDSQKIGIDVKNAAPEVSADDVTVETEDDPIALDVRVADPGHRDGEALQLAAAWDSSDPGLPTPITTTIAAGATQEFDLGTLPFGTYQLRLTVTDKDGGTATTVVQVSVGQSATVEPDDTIDTEPAPGCDFGITLGTQEADTIDLLNTYRAASHLPPVYASPTLTQAAQAHAQWMVDNGLLSHIGANGSTPQDRALAAGYPRENAVGENLAFTGPKPLDAIFGWRNSPTHNTNMLRPFWRAIGVARIVTADGTYWVHVFGDAVDCPPAPPGSAGPAKAGATGAAGATAAPAPGTTRQPAVAHFDSWGPNGEEGDPLDAPTVPGQPMFRPGEQPFVPPDAPPISFPPPPAGRPPADATFSALVVSNGSPPTGSPITLTNRSTRNGALLAAVLAVGDGRAPATAPPGGSTTFGVVTPGPLDVTITGTSGLALVRTIAVGGPPVVAIVSYLGDTSGVERSVAVLKAKVEASGTGVSGRTVTFTLGGLTASAVTGADGIAETKLRLALAAGPKTMQVDVAATTRDPAASTTAGFLVGAHAPPVADAGGPYTSLRSSALLLDASQSQASSGGGLAAAWDLDGDGQYDDATGLTPSIAWDDTANLVCAGTCASVTAYPVAVQVTDSLGSVDEASTTVTFTSTYALTVDPPVATLNPGGSASFTVSVVSQSGWDHPVHLSTVNLPAGVTAVFSTNDVTPNAAVTLTLTAAQDATASTVDFVIHAESDGVIRETGRSIDLEFGLVPSCYGTVTGSVVDAVTGAPVVHAWISQSTFSRADGTFTIDNIALGTGNRPTLFTIWSTQTLGYFDSDYSVTRTVGCGNPVTASLRLAPQQSSSMAGSVVEGIPDPFDRSATRAVTPSSTPIPDAYVRAGSSAPNGTASAVSGADGSYRLDPLRMGAGNLPTNYNINAAKSGYWQSTASVTVSPGSPVVRTFSMVKVCFGTIDLRVLDETTHKPITGASVQVSTEQGGRNGRTDANGRARLEPVALGVNNSSATRFVYVTATVNGRSVSASGSVVLPTCGSTALLDVTLRTPIERTASLTGRVVDEETNAPLANMTVSLTGTPTSPTVKTGADGTYHFTGEIIGYDTTTSVTAGISATDNRQGADPRYNGSATTVVTLTSGQTTSLGDLTMLRIRRGSIVGTVVDAVTGKPIGGATVFGEGANILTPEDGSFTIGSVALGPRNTPRTAQITAARTDYWFANAFVPVTADGPATTEIRLLRACPPASVQGRVINAATGAPLEGASVKWGPSSTDVVLTDANGHYVVPSIVVPQNRPFETSLLAYKDGFESQSRTATIQCDAHLTVDFTGPRVTTASIRGRVTEAASGDPIAGASVVGEWGGSAVTAADGTYTIANVPLADGGTARSWDVAVQPPVLSPLVGQHRSVSVSPSTESVADFALTGSTNHRPVATPQTITVDPGARGGIPIGGTDQDGDPIRVFPVGTAASWITFDSDGTQLFYVAPTDGTRSGAARFVVSDGKADSDPATVTILVAANAPAAVIAPAGPVDEGSPLALDGLGSSPSAHATITAYAWDLDHDGQYDDATGSSAQVTFPNDGTFTVGLRVTDSSGLSSTTSRAVQVDDVLPVVSAGPDVTIGADGGFTRTVTFTDPGADSWTGSVDWDGPGASAPVPVTITSHSFDITHTFGGPGTYPVVVQVCETPQGCGQDTVSVTVPSGPVNHPPTAVIAPVPPTAEGSTVTLDASGSTDADGPIASYSWDLDGDGTYGDATGPTTTRTYPDDRSFTVGVRVTDGAGATADATRVIVIDNVTPTVDLGPDLAIDQGQEVVRTALLTDPGADTLTATLDVDEGAGAEPAPVNGRQIDWTHTFTKAGVHTVTAEVCDDADACSTDTLIVNVAAPPPPDPIADLSVAISRTDPLVVGGIATYRLAVTNLGPDSTSGTVSVTSALPSGLANPVVTAPGWVCTVTVNDVACDRTAGIGAGPAPGITITAEVVAAEGATVDTTATIASTHDANPANDSATDTGVVQGAPKPHADVAVTVDGPSSGTVGTPLTWIVGVTNAGPDASGLVTLTFELPAGATGGNAAGTGWTCSGTTCTHDPLGAPAAAPPAAPAAAVSPSASVTVTAIPTRSGAATFSATVTAAVDDPNLADNTAKRTTSIQDVTTTTSTTTTTTSTTTTTTTTPTSTSTTMTPTTSSTTTTAGASTTTSVATISPGGVSTTPTSDGTGTLPRTGSNVGVVPWAFALVAFGFALVAFGRRRRTGSAMGDR